MKIIFYLIVAIALFTSCKKTVSNNTAGDVCADIKATKIVAPSVVVYGQQINVDVEKVVEETIYDWRGPANFSTYSNKFEFFNATLRNRGMYYLNVNNQDCETHVDSVYINVKLPQGTPTCNTTMNTGMYNNLANDSYTTVSKGIDASYGYKSLNCYGVGTLKVLFQQYWLNKEPEDGIYTTISSPTFDQIDYEFNKVFVTTTKSSIYWASQPDQKVYVSHVNGKLQVRFCDLILSGYNGTSFTTKLSTNIIQTN